MARRARRGNVKSREEAKVERRTWLALAGVFILLSLFDPENTLPDYTVSFTISFILIASGIYQFMQSDDNETWRVSPITWIVPAILIMLSILDIVSDFRGWISIPVDLRLLSLAGTYLVIILGILTNEA
ncbi:MAG: hypothetical protein ACFE0Q_09400 [Anaerolineae bacterium]